MKFHLARRRHVSEYEPDAGLETGGLEGSGGDACHEGEVSEVEKETCIGAYAGYAQVGHLGPSSVNGIWGSINMEGKKSFQAKEFTD